MICPLFELALINSAAELIDITSPCLVAAMDKKLCDFIKDEAERISQIKEPSLILKEKTLLSWLIKKILLSKTFIFDFNGTPWFLIQISFPLSESMT